MRRKVEGSNVDKNALREYLDLINKHKLDQSLREWLNSMPEDLSQRIQLAQPKTRTNADPTLTVFHEPNDVEHPDR